jgi:hypothetical protein
MICSALLKTYYSRLIFRESRSDYCTFFLPRYLMLLTEQSLQNMSLSSTSEPQNPKSSADKALYWSPKNYAAHQIAAWRAAAKL